MAKYIAQRQIIVNTKRNVHPFILTAESSSLNRSVHQ